jgi:hypothetical protein
MVKESKRGKLGQLSSTRLMRASIHTGDGDVVWACVQHPAWQVRTEIGRNINGVRDLGNFNGQGVYCSCQYVKASERINGENFIMGIIMGLPNQKE